jgi:hypothetical protein
VQLCAPQPVGVQSTHVLYSWLHSHKYHRDINFLTLCHMRCCAIVARINDHHHNLKHYFEHTLEADVQKPMEWCVGGSSSNSSRTLTARTAAAVAALPALTAAAPSTPHPDSTLSTPSSWYRFWARFLGGLVLPPASNPIYGHHHHLRVVLTMPFCVFVTLWLCVLFCAVLMQDCTAGGVAHTAGGCPPLRPLLAGGWSAAGSARRPL